MQQVEIPQRISLSTLLVATDFSSCSETALRYACALARQQRGKILLGHVVPAEPRYPMPAETVPAEPVWEAQDARLQLEKAAGVPELSGIDHQTLLRQGEFWPELEQMIQQNDVELVVVGTHGREGLKKLLLGSAAEEVLRLARCPVLTVGPHVKPETLENGRLQRVLCATDLGSGSLHALPMALWLAEQNQAALTVVYAVSSDVIATEFGPVTLPEQRIEDAREEVRQLLPPEVHAGIVVETGYPAEVIVEAARQQDASLIVMGLHHHSSFVATRLPWTTAHRVVCDAPCPVMTVR